MFSDNPVPPLHDALRMFSRAWMVIGPHGAGLSNMFFTEPGTVVLEGLCYNKGKANLCYRYGRDHVATTLSSRSRAQSRNFRIARPAV